jgi:hypothetical protein
MNTVKKKYWKVKSEFGPSGSFIGAWLFSRIREAKPHDTKHSRKNSVVFWDWFETKEEAVSYMDDVRGGK